jgi:tetratricopeptide (TPR) repeat protein
MKPFRIYLIIAFVVVPVFGFSQKAERSNVRKGNKQYEKEKYTEAEILYRKALEVNPQSPEGNYNLGNALFRQKKAKEALQAYQMALNKQNDPLKKAQIFHNAGTLFLATEQYEQAVDALKMSLRLNPNDNETRYNLALAQALLKKQPPKKQDKNKDKKDDKKDDQQQQQQQQDDQEKKDQQNKKQQQQQQQEQVTKEKAKQLLDALSQDEKDTQEKVKRLQMQQSKPRKTDKDW